ncbi:MAG: type CRISPR-associated protein Cas10/Cmr2, partial [Pseudomonadota bacterium]
SFIEAARSTSDLWAGSHLLSRLAWEMMRPLCELLGPDAVLFPRLRGVPQVDLWLQTQDVPSQLFDECAWRKKSTDQNPLFSAALPNRFVALVPASQAKQLAHKCEQAVSAWLQAQGIATVDALLKELSAENKDCHAYTQMREQLQGFPDVHWAAVPFSLVAIGDKAKQGDLDVTALKQSMAPFYGTAPEAAAGFLASPAWQLLSQEIKWDDRTCFWQPNPGVLYPAVLELAERLLTAAKSQRKVTTLTQGGYRDSLTGEVEWLTDNPEHLKLSSGQREDANTLWTRIAEQKQSWAKAGEHLGGLAAIKRLWPTMFAQEIATATGQDEVSRFVVSTHTMALAKPLQTWLAEGAKGAEKLHEIVELNSIESVALPAKLLANRDLSKAEIQLAKTIPALLDLADNAETYTIAHKDRRRLTAGGKEPIEANKLRQQVKDVLSPDASLETYYALVLLDGDKMGKILAGDEAYAISYAESFHPNTREGFVDYAATRPKLQNYQNQKRALSPNRHLAISGALNDFALTIARHVVEKEFLGRLIYAGGDDVLAMLPVADALPCALRLSQAYRGVLPEDIDKDWGVLKQEPQALHCKNGFAYLKGQLMRMMGERATCSAGIVIAHHQTPLNAALRELREAEKRAKNAGGRDAFSIALLKRSGGETHFTAKWSSMPLLEILVSFLREESVSRRAVYHTLAWMVDLPQAWHEAMFAPLIAYQFARQTSDVALKKNAKDVAGRVVEHLSKLNAEPAFNWKSELRSLLTTAEFLARETRGEVMSTNKKEST